MFGKLGVEGIMEKRNVEGNFVFFGVEFIKTV